MTQALTDRRNLLAIQIVIFLTGFTFLIYEVSWHRLLSLVLGTTVTASTIVLASFMAGFGTGAWLWGRIANTRRAVGRLLGGLLIGAALFSAGNFLIFTRVIPQMYADSAAPEVLVFALATVCLFLPACLLGGAFPLISKIAIKPTDQVAATLGRLYAVETIGSTLGGLLTGFVLLGQLGQAKTLGLAIAINLGLALWLLAANKFNNISPVDTENAVDEAPVERTGKKARGTETVSPATLRRTALVGAFVCGLCILSLQVLWIRMFRIYLTNTSYTFALVSSLAILGLFAGSTLFKRRAQRNKDFQRSMFKVLMGMIITTILGLLLLVNLPELLMFPFASVLRNPMTRVIVLPVIASLLIVFPPSMFSGYAFPLACRMYAAGAQNISRDVGFVLMVNTIGSVLGPVLAAFVLLPMLGAGLALLLVVLLLVSTALFVQRRLTVPAETVHARNGLYVVAAVLLITLFVRPDIRILPPSFHRFDRDILFYRESVEGTLSVGQDTGSRTRSKYTFVNNAAVIGSSYDAVKVVKMVGHFPFLLGLECQDVLVIGFGIGVTTSAIASHDEVKSIECVELVTGLKDAAHFYKDLNQNVVQDPRLNIISGDGRHYLQKTPNTYDLISCDPTHPILGSGNLYTADYFNLCKSHLNPGGMVSQYLPLHKLRPEEFLGLLRTFESVFPHSTIWLGHYHAVLLGSTEPLDVDFNDWAARVESIEEDDYFYIDPHHLAATLMLDGASIAQLGTESRINTDNQSYTEFFNPACLDEDNLVKNLRFFMENRCDIGAIFKNIDDEARMERFLRGNQKLNESLYYSLSGDNRRGLMALQQAVQVNPEDQEYPFLIRLNY